MNKQSRREPIGRRILDSGKQINNTSVSECPLTSPTYITEYNTNKMIKNGSVVTLVFGSTANCIRINESTPVYHDGRPNVLLKRVRACERTGPTPHFVKILLENLYLAFQRTPEERVRRVRSYVRRRRVGPNITRTTRPTRRQYRNYLTRCKINVQY